jgi:bacterioferritin
MGCVTCEGKRLGRHYLLSTIRGNMKNLNQILNEAEIDPNSDTNLVPLLNKALGMEYGAIIQYYHNKAVFTGVHAAQYQEIAGHNVGEEIKHVEMLIDKIVVLGGEPTIEVLGTNPANTISDILVNDIKGEGEALAIYYEIHEKAKDLSLKLLIENIITDEQDHLDGLRKMQIKMKE